MFQLKHFYQFVSFVYSQFDSFDGSGAHGGSPVALGARRTVGSLTLVPQMCILCQEEQELTHTGRSLVLCAYVQRYDSTDMRQLYIIRPRCSRSAAAYSHQTFP